MSSAPRLVLLLLLLLALLHVPLASGRISLADHWRKIVERARCSKRPSSSLFPKIPHSDPKCRRSCDDCDCKIGTCWTIPEVCPVQGFLNSSYAKEYFEYLTDPYTKVCLRRPHHKPNDLKWNCALDCATLCYCSQCPADPCCKRKDPRELATCLTQRKLTICNEMPGGDLEGSILSRRRREATLDPFQCYAEAKTFCATGSFSACDAFVRENCITYNKDTLAEMMCIGRCSK